MEPVLAHLHPVHGVFSSSQRTPFRMQQAARCCQPFRLPSPGRPSIYWHRAKVHEMNMASPTRNPSFNLSAIHELPFRGPCPAVPLGNPSDSC